MRSNSLISESTMKTEFCCRRRRMHPLTTSPLKISSHFKTQISRFRVLLEGGLESKDWLKVCESLNDVRRFTLYHSSLLQPILEKVLLVMVKSIKNPRSALCKTSIMASFDIFNAFGENLLDSASDAFSQLLLQLLLKASQEKKFVCEAHRLRWEFMWNWLFVGLNFWDLD